MVIISDTFGHQVLIREPLVEMGLFADHVKVTLSTFESLNRSLNYDAIKIKLNTKMTKHMRALNTSSFGRLTPPNYRKQSL